MNKNNKLNKLNKENDLATKCNMKNGKKINNSKTIKKEYEFAMYDSSVIGSWITIKRFEKAIESGDYSVQFQFRDANLGDIVSVTLRRDKITPKTLENIMNQKGGVNLDAKAMYEHFCIEESKARNQPNSFGGIRSKVLDLEDNVIMYDVNIAEVCSTHKMVGWMDENTFCSDYIIGADGCINSEYVGSLRINATGDKEVYLDMIRKYVVDRIPLESMIAMGTAATVLPYANMKWDANLYNTVNHIFADSTTGKTTATMLAISLGGYPEKTDGDSLFLTFNATFNSLFKKLNNNFGLPVAIDEASMIQTKDITPHIYALAEGSEKERLSRDGSSLQRKSNFSTIFITNGEGSLLTFCNENGGLSCRLLEFNNIQWTESAESANHIKTICLNNYGHISPMLAEELMKDTEDKWKEKMQSWMNKFSQDERCVGGMTAIIERVIKTLSLYMVSAEIFSEVTGIELHYNDIYEFFFENVVLRIVDKNNIGMRAYNVLMQYYAINNMNFIEYDFTHNGYPEWKSDTLGIKYRVRTPKEIDGKTCSWILFFEKKKFQKIMSEEKFSDASVILHKLDSMNLLKTKGGKHLDCDIKLYNDSKINGYAIYIPDVDEDIEAEL